MPTYMRQNKRTTVVVLPKGAHEYPHLQTKIDFVTGVEDTSTSLSTNILSSQIWKH